jgi:hypothetical protein
MEHAGEIKILKKKKKNTHTHTQTNFLQIVTSDFNRVKGTGE